jgi:integrase
MAKAKQRSWQSFQNETKPGRYGDGGGLYLQISASGGRSWAFRYMLNGKSHQMGLGPEDLLSLSEAREAAREKRKLLKIHGVDPLEARRKQRLDAQLEAARSVTFEDCARRFIAAHSPAWRNERHTEQWRTTLATYVYPKIGHLPVSSIDVALVLQVLEPIWERIPESASRVRGRIEAILNWAHTSGFRTGENPAQWRGRLSNLLAPHRKLKAVKHHSALPYRDLPDFMAQLRKCEGLGARALELIILTNLRNKEGRLGTWDEIDLEARIWTIPAERMKAEKEFRVPLSTAALAVLAQLPRMAGSPYLFPGAVDGRPISEMPLRDVRNALRKGLTTHGFRSSFRDWSAETTQFPNHVAEMAMAHEIPSAVEKAYRRGDLFEKRRELMEAWARYCGSAGRA